MRVKGGEGSEAPFTTVSASYAADYTIKVKGEGCF